MTGGRKRRPPARPKRQRLTRTPRTAGAGRERRPQRAKAPDSRERLVVHAAETVPFTDERRAQARLALRVLYADFLAGGGLDSVRASRCPEAPTEDPTEEPEP